MSKVDDILERMREERRARLSRSVTHYDELCGVTSNEGPACPYCGDEVTADEGYYFDENRFTEGTCDACGAEYRVQVEIVTTWRTFRK